MVDTVQLPLHSPFDSDKSMLNFSSKTFIYFGVWAKAFSKHNGTIFQVEYIAHLDVLVSNLIGHRHDQGNSISTI